MTEQVHGIYSVDDVIVDSLYSYRVFTKLNIKLTNVYSDVSQRNFNLLMGYLSRRAQAVSITNTEFVISLYHVGAPTLCGPGYWFDFGVDVKSAYENIGNGTIGPVGLLIDELDKQPLFDSVIITKGSDVNTEFFKL